MACRCDGIAIAGGILPHNNDANAATAMSLCFIPDHQPTFYTDRRSTQRSVIRITPSSLPQKVLQAGLQIPEPERIARGNKFRRLYTLAGEE